MNQDYMDPTYVQDGKERFRQAVVNAFERHSDSIFDDATERLECEMRELCANHFGVSRLDDLADAFVYFAYGYRFGVGDTDADKLPAVFGGEAGEA